MSTGTGSGGQSLTTSGSAGWSPPALGHSQSLAQQLQGSASMASAGLATTPPAVGLGNDHSNSYGSGLGSGLTSAATTTSSGLTVSPALLAGSSPSFPSLGQTQTTSNEPYLGQNAAVFDLSDFPALGVGMSGSQGLGNSSQTSFAGMTGGNTTGNAIMGYGRVLSSPYALSQRSELSAQDFPALGSKLTNSGALNAYTRTNPSLGAVGSSLAMGMTPTLAGTPALSASSAGLTTPLGSTASTLPPVTAAGVGAAAAGAQPTAPRSHVPNLASLPGVLGATATRSEATEWSTRHGIEFNPSTRLAAAPSLAGDVSGRSSALNTAATAAGPSSSGSSSSIPTNSLNVSLGAADALPLVSNTDSGAWTSPYGMSGLLATIRSQNPDLSLLAHGVDLTGLGLNLNSSEPLYASFTSPFLNDLLSDGLTSSVPVSAERPDTATETPYTLPSCYSYCNVTLKPSHFKRFTIETLALIFYGYPRDLVQVYAALEWFNRGWRYHKELKTWFAQASPALEAGHAETNDGKSLTHSGGQLVYFDIHSWAVKPFTNTVPPANFVRNFLTEAELREMVISRK